MMKNLRNFVVLRGNLGKDPEFKELGNGNKLARFSLATNESYKNAKGEWIDRTNWVSCISWGKTAEKITNTLKKGNQIMITGKLNSRLVEGEDGRKRQYTDIEVQDFAPVK